MDNKEIFNRIFPTACRYMRVDPVKVDMEFNDKAFTTFETLIDNVFPRVKYIVMLRVTWAVILAFAGTNLLILNVLK